MASLTAPFGDLESLGVGKESSFGTFATPTIFHAFNQFDPKPMNALVARTGARKHYGQSRPAIAGYEATAALDAEFDPDTIAQLIAYGMGGQTTPSTTIFSGNLSAATIIGATTFSITTTTSMVDDPGFLIPGMVVTIDTAANQETLTILTVTPSNSTTTPCTITTTAAATKAHASAVIISVTATGAYASSLTMSTLPSFSIELNRITDIIRYVGCMVETMNFTLNPKSGLNVKFGLLYQTETVAGSATTPVYSTKLPLMFEHPYNCALFNASVIGPVGTVAVLGITINVANNLMKNYYSFGQGRSVQSFPQQLRKITGSMTLGFETNAAYLAFLGASTGPAPITVPQVNLGFSAVGPDIIDATTGTPFSFRFILQNTTLSTHAVPNKSTAVLQQTFQFEAAESVASANDDLKINYIGSNLAVF